MAKNENTRQSSPGETRKCPHEPGRDCIHPLWGCCVGCPVFENDDDGE